MQTEYPSLVGLKGRARTILLNIQLQKKYFRQIMSIEYVSGFAALEQGLTVVITDKRGFDLIPKEIEGSHVIIEFNPSLGCYAV